jgi:hypothetical protein
MALESNLNRKVFTASASQSAFAFGDVLYFDQEHLKVYQNGELLTLGVDYTVNPTTNTPNGTPGGTVTLTEAADEDDQIIILREVPLIQEIDYEEFGKFPANTHEQGLDYLTMITQQHAEKFGRQFTIPVTEAGTEDLVTLPALAERKGKYLGFDETTGYPVMLGAPTTTSLTTAFTESLLDDSSGGNFIGTLVDDLEVMTAPDADDVMIVREIGSHGRGTQITLPNFFKVINALTADATPDLAADYLVTYDASASAAKKILLNTLAPIASQAEVNAMVSTTKLITPSHNRIVQGSVVAASSSAVFLGSSLPAGIKRITVQFNGISLSGTDHLLIQLGDAGGIETTGYVTSSMNQAGTVVNSTAGFIIYCGTAAGIVSGAITLTLLSTAAFFWVASGNVKISTSAMSYAAGEKSLSAELTQLQLTVSGADTFDAGAVSVIYER